MPCRYDTRAGTLLVEAGMVREEQNSAGHIHIGEGEGEGAGAARQGACLDVGIPASLVHMPNACPLRTRDHESMPLGRAPSHDITRPLRFLIKAVEHDDQAAGISTRLVGGHIHAEFTPPITHRYRHVRVAHRQRTCCCHGGQDEHCATCSGMYRRPACTGDQFSAIQFLPRFPFSLCVLFGFPSSCPIGLLGWFVFFFTGVCYLYSTSVHSSYSTQSLILHQHSLSVSTFYPKPVCK